MIAALHDATWRSHPYRRLVRDFKLKILSGNRGKRPKRKGKERKEAEDHTA
jgi:hypothetical protein